METSNWPKPGTSAWPPADTFSRPRTTPLARNEFICWVEDAEQEMTRERRIRRTQRSWRKASVGPAAGQGAGTVSAPADSDQRLHRIPNVPSCASDERHGR